MPPPRPLKNYLQGRTSTRNRLFFLERRIGSRSPLLPSKPGRAGKGRTAPDNSPGFLLTSCPPLLINFNMKLQMDCAPSRPGSPFFSGLVSRSPPFPAYTLIRGPPPVVLGSSRALLLFPDTLTSVFSSAFSPATCLVPKTRRTLEPPSRHLSVRFPKKISSVRRSPSVSSCTPRPC